MRKLKDGTVKYKPSAYKEVERLTKPATPMDVYPKGTKLSVYIAAGWALGYVRFSSPKMCVLALAKDNRQITCTDNRNLMKPVEKER